MTPNEHTATVVRIVCDVLSSTVRRMSAEPAYENTTAPMALREVAGLIAESGDEIIKRIKEVSS